MLADKAYPSWSGGQRKEMVRDQFIRGICSSSIQLKLMRDKPSSLEEAVKWASQQEGVEDAQRKLQCAWLLVGKQKFYLQMQKVWWQTVGEMRVPSQQYERNAVYREETRCIGTGRAAL